MANKSTVLFIFLSLITLALVVQSSQQPQSLRSKAITDAPLGTVTLPITLPVLVLQYFPPDPNNPTLLDGVETGWGANATIGGRTLAWWEARTDEMVTAMLPYASEASRYHGYKNPTAPAFFNFVVADTKKYYLPIPRGASLGTNRYRPHYGQILTNLDICNYVDSLGVKEVWMYGYHSSVIEPDESRMSSRHGDVSNSFPKEEAIPSQFRMPICNNSYVLYNYTYQPGGATAIANAVHNRLHQVENIIPFADGVGKWPPIREDQSNTNIPGSIFWGDFSEYIQDYTVRSSYNSSCGNAHYTPNWTDLANHGYRYNLTAPRQFNCETWHPDDNQTTYISAGCERWGCTDMGFYKWWMQNIPGFNNGIIHNGQAMKNWWEAMYDFNAFIENGRSLYGSSLFNVITTSPTPPGPTAAPDFINPSVEIATPLAGDKVRDITHIMTTATDNVGVVSHKILIDNFKPNSGTLLLKECGAVTACTHDLNIDTMELLPDERPNHFVIVVEARDAHGNLGRKYIEVEAVRGVTPTPTAKPGDVNGDNLVNLTDLSTLLSNFGKAGTTKSQGDLDGNSSVNLQDLTVLLSNFGK